MASLRGSFVLLSMILLSIFSTSTALDAATVNSIVPAVVEALNNQPGNSLMHATLLRLTFHDCAGVSGCDGCINTGTPANFGLQRSVDFIEGVYDGSILTLTTTDISRADLWALAGIIAAEYGAEGGRNVNAANIELPGYTWGRVDCATSPNDPAEVSQTFPDAKMAVDATLAYFNDTFGFTAQESVAILGE
jgi:hypothetical protein